VQVALVLISSEPPPKKKGMAMNETLRKLTIDGEDLKPKNDESFDLDDLLHPAQALAGRGREGSLRDAFPERASNARDYSKDCRSAAATVYKRTKWPKPMRQRLARDQNRLQLPAYWVSPSRCNATGVRVTPSGVRPRSLTYRTACDAHHGPHKANLQSCVIDNVADRAGKPLAEPTNAWREDMRTALVAAAIVLTMVAGSAQARITTNALTGNGLQLNALTLNTGFTNGVVLNGYSLNTGYTNGYGLNGLWENGVWQNGLWQNGLWAKGVVLNGRTGVGRDTSATPTTIGSADLTAVELPR
jgi:hypothetical protein